MTVGGKEFQFKKPVTKHVLNLRTKGYQEWFESEALNESTSSAENHKAYSDRWREFCRDAIILGDPFPVELEFENLTFAEVGHIVRSFFESLPGTPPEQEKPSSDLQDSGNKPKSV